ncbi:hypothetical protein [Bifidobacterium crudilactis]|jgi:hypothetical protein|uniref:hypothetical protein n=1 Tax=Bifidobacterium crudilactis TaxID=327277 RepID=UPI002353C9EF|nr:hypothetical protein [Bifidobacterium crudilactis]MCI1868522.1 hypothetical protein [Bifidobacterium crudilactis]
MTKNTQTGLNVQAVQLTPKMANELLARNTHNRNVSQARVDVWTEAMKRGEWRMNGEAIKISGDGTILDGQHRLYAVVKSGVTIPILIITGLPRQSQETMDTGKSRKLADVLTLRGEKNTALLAAVVTGLARYERWGVQAAFLSTNSYPVTNGQALAWLEDHPDVHDSVNVARSVGSHASAPGKIIGILHYRFTHINVEDGEDFFDKLDTGAGMEQGHPILALRKQLKLIHDDPMQGYNPQRVSGLIIKAWNKYRDGDMDVKLLRFTVGGAHPERIPEAR